MPQEESVSKILDQVTSKVLTCKVLPKSSSTWGGAGVVVTFPKQGNEQDVGDSFSRSVDYVRTEYALQVSWVFFTLRDIFHHAKLLDYLSKLEFFGRMAEAVNWFLQHENKPTGKELMLSILHEGFIMLDEIQHRRFGHYSHDGNLRAGPDRQMLIEFVRSKGMIFSENQDVN